MPSARDRKGIFLPPLLFIKSKKGQQIDWGRGCGKHFPITFANIKRLSPSSLAGPFRRMSGTCRFRWDQKFTSVVWVRGLVGLLFPFPFKREFFERKWLRMWSFKKILEAFFRCRKFKSKCANLQPFLFNKIQQIITKMYDKAVVTNSLKINETALPNETFLPVIQNKCSLNAICGEKRSPLKARLSGFVVWVGPNSDLTRTNVWMCLHVKVMVYSLVRTSEGVLRDLCENVWAICQIFHCCCVVDSFELFAVRTPYQIVIHVSWARNERAELAVNIDYIIKQVLAIVLTMIHFR